MKKLKQILETILLWIESSLCFALRKSNLKGEIILCFTYLIRIIQAVILL